MEQNRFDVIVVGGGPAGITAATALGKSGFSVLVCEAAVYAGAENWSGAVYFTENLEADDAFGRETVERAPFERRLIERGFYLYNGHSLLGATLRDPGVFRSCYTVLRPVYDRYLAEVSREHGVVLLCETTVQSLIRHRGRVVGVHTERGPAYADVVFLAEGDASHLVTQEGYETVGADAAGGNGGGRSHGAGGHDGARGRGAGDGDRGGRGQTGGSSLDAGDHGGPHFLQGIKEVITLPPGAIEERFGLPEAGGGAYEMLLRNGSRGGRTVRLNMGGFLYTNRDSISLGLVLPVDNLSRGFDGDHNLLMEWFKGLPEVARWIEGGEVTSYGAKIIRGGGAREIPRLVDDGLAIGGAASGIGIDFPYPNFTGPATAMGLLFARAVGAIAADHGGPGGGGRGNVDPGGGGTGVGRRPSPFTAAALEHAYLKPLRQTHYYRNVERLADWPGYVERTRFFFERQLDVVNGMAFVVSRPDIGGPRRWWEALRLKRRVLGKRFGSALGDLRANSAALGLGRAAWAGLGAGTVGRWLLNTVAALLPSSRARTGGDAVTGVAEAEGPGGARFRMVFRVMAGAEPAGRMPLLARWYWKRFAPSLAGAFADVYTNDDEPLDDKLPRALGRVIGCLSVWDLLAAVVMAPAAVATMAAQAAVEAFQYFVLKKDLGEFREQLVARLLEGNRARLRLDDDAVEIRTSYEHKLGTIRYREGEHSHIKVMWPDELAARGELRESPLWSVCPAKVYELEVNPRGMPGVIVNFDNCVKCETCWRATPDVHWSRATQQRLIYETYTPAHGELRRYLLGRPEPVPRLSRSPGFWEEYWAATTVPVALGADSNSSVSSGTIDDRDHAAVREADASATEARQAGIELHAGARVALAGVAAELDRFAVTLEGYSTALGGSPLTLERGQRRYLEELLGVAARRFASARAIWLTDPLAPLRDRFGEPGAGLWGDAADRVEELSRHAAARRYFWSDVLGKQLHDHHLRGLRRLLELAGWSNAEAERAAIVRSGFLDQPDAAGAGKEASGGTPTAAGTGPETEGGPFDDARSREVGGGGPLDAVSARVWAAEWRRIEGRPAELDGVRRGIREWRDEHLDGAALRALEEQEPPGPELRGWLAGQLQAAVATGRPPAGERGRDRASGSAYGRRDVLLEELAAVDPSLAVLAGQHLLACDLLAGAAGSDTLAGDLRAGRALATVVSQGSISNRPLVSGDDVVDQGEALAAGAAELHGEAPLVAAALADWLLVVRSERCYLVPAGDPGLRLEPVGCIGLLGAGVRRAAFEGCVVPAERIFISAALAAVTGVAPQSFEVGKSADSSGAREAAGLMGEAVGPDATAATAIPPAGEPYTDLLPIAVADHLAIVRGAGDYLTRRAREHAASRVQFPGSMEDEAGRDSIAKFGAVKQLLAEMEARRILVETLSIIDPGPADDPWVGAAVRKVCAADAFGPAEGSFGYNCGQIFGGTSFSEDDNIAKYYRDSSPFRFLLAHDDALRVEIGRRRLAAVREGRSLIPVSADETAWLDEAAGAGSLSDIVSSWRAAAEEIESWAAGAASSGAAGGDGDGSIEPSTDDGFRNAGDGLAELICHQAGEAVLQVLAVKACILRTAWRLECGLAAQATLQATALLSDRLVAAAPALVAGAGLLSDALRVGRETIAEGDFEPGAAIPDAEPYDAVLATDHAAESGEWLIRPFDAGHLRYLPEILWNDAGLRAFRERLEAAQRRRFVEPLFDGLPYGRYLEKIHIVPAEDLDYLIEHGYLRMPIPAELGGEGAHKAEYYILCEMTGRFGDAALSLAIMANTSIGTTPVLLGLGQDLPRARAELEKVKADPALLGDIRAGLDAIIGGLARPDLEALQRGYLALSELVKARILKSSVLKYIGAGFLRAFFEAGAAGQQRDLDGFAAGLREARQRIDEILEGVDGRLLEYPRRVRAHELFLKLISAGYISAFALTEPTAGSDSGGVKTTAKLTRRRVHEDDDGVLWFWLDEEGKTGRRNLLDADRLELDYERRRILYRWSADVDPSEIDHDGYDYEKDRAGRWRAYDHGGRRVDFTDIAQIRSDDSGQRWYEFWELSGAKMWITNGRFAHCFALYARTEPEGVTGFMVDRHAEGLVVGADEEKLGQRGSPTNELSLTGVRVPRECIIGFRGRGQVNALETLNAGRTGLAVTTRSTIQEMIEDALDFLGSETEGQDVPAGRYPRQQGPPTPLQVFWMGRLTEELMTTAALSNELIGLFDHPLTRDTRMESAIGKYYGSEAEHEGIDWMERLRGLDGQTHRHRIEKTRRDARVLNIYEGTNEVQRFLLLRDLAQRVLPAWQAAGGKATGGQSAAATSSAPGDEASGVPGLAAGYAAAAATHAGAHPDLRERLEGAKSRLLSRLAEAQGSFGDIVWSNVNLQPCFFRLVEIAGLIKVMDALLYRLEWLASHRTPEGYRRRIESASRLAFERSLVRIETLHRRYDAAYAYLKDGRYPPDAQLGFLSLDPHGAAAERWGALPAAPDVAAGAAALSRPIRIAVLVKPVPVVAPRPRFGDGALAEALYDIDRVDARSLELALALKRRDPDRVSVTAYSLAGVPGAEVLRRALAMGVDGASLLTVDANGGQAVLQDPTSVARLVRAALADEPADVVMCGAAAADTGQGVVAPALAAGLDCDHIEGVLAASWAEGAEPRLRLTARGWQGHELDLPLPCVLAVAPVAERATLAFGLEGFLAAAVADLPRRRLDAGAFGAWPMPVEQRARTLVARAARGKVARTPEEAAAVVLEIAGLTGAAAATPIEPYGGDPLGFGQQPDDGARSCLFVCEPMSGEELAASTLAALGAAARLARGVDLPLDVVLPVTSRAARNRGIARLVAGAAPRRIYALEHPRLDRFGWKGHLEWFQELWGMYRGEARWLLGPEWAGTMFARFAGEGPPGVDRAWPWLHVGAIENGDGPLRLGSSIFDGAGWAFAAPPAEGLRIVTLTPEAEVRLAAATEGAASEAAATETAATEAPATEVFAYEPRLDYDPDADPVAALLARLGGGEPTLRDADYVVDFGYGAGGREGLETLAEPLLAVLVDELGLADAMIGGTRKVTQDLEVLPMDRQIGQTGVRVSPKVLVALGVSGAPQHVDWIGDHTVILAFNIDPEAPLMKLNEQRPSPVVHPIVGDVKETVPRFIAALRAAAAGD